MGENLRVCVLCEIERRSLEHLSLDDQERLMWAATKQEVLFFGIIDILTVRLRNSLSPPDSHVMLVTT